jgi:hypothetical protein
MVKWFGKSWGAPLCQDAEHAPTPTGALCLGCDDEIRDGQKGLLIPFVSLTEPPSIRPWHLECFLLSVGAIKEVHVLSHGFSLCHLSGTPREWPEGHRWVSVEDGRRATCPTCKERLPEAVTAARARKNAP